TAESRGLASPALGLPEDQHIGGVARVIALRTSLRVSTPSSPASAARGPRRWSPTALAAPPSRTAAMRDRARAREQRRWFERPAGAELAVRCGCPLPAPGVGRCRLSHVLRALPRRASLPPRRIPGTPSDQLMRSCYVRRRHGGPRLR